MVDIDKLAHDMALKTAEAWRSHHAKLTDLCVDVSVSGFGLFIIGGIFQLDSDLMWVLASFIGILVGCSLYHIFRGLHWQAVLRKIKADKEALDNTIS